MAVSNIQIALAAKKDMDKAMGEAMGLEAVAFIGGSLNGEIRIIDKLVATYRHQITMGVVSVWNLDPQTKRPLSITIKSPWRWLINTLEI